MCITTSILYIYNIHTLRFCQEKRELYQLRWEINKVGTNINQATKRINSSNGTYSDIVDLLSSQEKIMSLIEEFENKIEDIWQ